MRKYRRSGELCGRKTKMNLPYCILGVTVLLDRNGFFDFHRSVQYLLVKSSNKITSDHYSSWKFLHCMLKAVEVPIIPCPILLTQGRRSRKMKCKHWYGGVWGHAPLENCHVFARGLLSGMVTFRKKSQRSSGKKKKNILWTKLPRSEGAPPAPPPEWSLLTLPPPPPPIFSPSPTHFPGWEG